ncbi:hypothetical protein [Salsuginibacillus kocurii]|uniref:hypothetical protein n=1 Tax=Salsuginibacillus kocurii TaxID=427078 RepID=UPI0003716EC4|nr:hypothetical protein [Salsuginibacillus kocurii]
MIFRFGLMVIGFSLAVSGGVSLIGYFNYLATGYDVRTFMDFIVHRIELYFFITGCILISSSFYIPELNNRRKQ